MQMSITSIRSMIEAGMNDDEIIDAYAAAEEQDAAFGSDDQHDLPTHSVHLSDDAYYQKNDAGEYSWM